MDELEYYFLAAESYGINTLGTLIGLIALLWIASLITKEKSDNPQNIKKACVNVLFRIGIFISTYLLFIVLGFVLLAFGIYAGINVIYNPASIFDVLFTIVLWVVLGSIAIILIRPLFQFGNNEQKGRKKIEYHEAPELFRVIEETAKKVGIPAPKDVYISPDVNACVFYNNSFWNLFFPSKKNLEIGMGIMLGTNQSELEAVIAHEFGHFAQKTTKILPYISSEYKIAQNIVTYRDGVDELLEAMSEIHFFGISACVLTYIGIVKLVRKCINAAFQYMDKGYLILSRQMEYDADDVSSGAIGSSAMISALCKLDIIDEKIDSYNSLLQNIEENYQVSPSSYWNGYHLFLQVFEKNEYIKISPEVVLHKPHMPYGKSRIQTEDQWLSHPTLENRILNITTNGTTDKEINTKASISLIPTELRNEVCDKILASKKVDDAEYKKLILNLFYECTFSKELRPYLNKQIMRPTSMDYQEIEENPINEHNALLLEEYRQGCEDYTTLLQFRNWGLGNKHIRYGNDVYSRKNAPVEIHAEYLERLKKEIEPIDNLVYQYALKVSKDKELVKQAYNNIFDVQDSIAEIKEQMFAARDTLYNTICTTKHYDEANFIESKDDLLKFKEYLTLFMDDFGWDKLRPIITEKEWTLFTGIKTDKYMFRMGTISMTEINSLLIFPEQIVKFLNRYAFYSQKIIEACLLGMEPRLVWHNSIAAKEESAKE